MSFSENDIAVTALKRTKMDVLTSSLQLKSAAQQKANKMYKAGNKKISMCISTMFGLNTYATNTDSKFG